MFWRDLINVQNVEKGFFTSSNSYGIPDIKKDEFEVDEFIPYIKQLKNLKVVAVLLLLFLLWSSRS